MLLLCLLTNYDLFQNTHLNVCDDAPALAAPPEKPNCGAARAAAIKANKTMKNFILKLVFLCVFTGKCDQTGFKNQTK